MHSSDLLSAEHIFFWLLFSFFFPLTEIPLTHIVDPIFEANNIDPQLREWRLYF